MSKKIHQNAICPLCNSGLKYKNCCGKNLGIRFTNLQYLCNPPQNLTEFDKEVYNKIGFYPSDFITPIKTLTDVIYIIIDESSLNDYYCVSGVVVLKSELDNNLKVNADLHNLIEKYNIDYIHFTEIFGRDNLLGINKHKFIGEFTNIVNQLNTIPFTTCMAKDEICSWLKTTDVTTEQCYIALTWKLIFNILIYCITTYGNNLIIEIWRESDNTTNEKRLLHQQNCIDLLKYFPFANISFYKDYLIFSKRNILFSSLADLVAYTTIRTFPKLNISAKKIIKNNNELFNLFKNSFHNTTYLKNDKFNDILNSL